jgi:hypothetical protein
MSTDQRAILALQPPASDAQDWAITVPGTYLGDWFEDFDGMVALSMQIRFLYGSAGTSLRACIQSSMDQGTTAYDVLIADFATATDTVLASVAASGQLFDKTEISDGGALLGGGQAPAGLRSTVLGDRLRLKLIVTGTYANTTVSARVMAG